MGHGRCGEILVVMQLALLQSVHSKSEIGPVKERGIFRPSDGVVAVENVQRWGQRQRGSVGRVWLI